MHDARRATEPNRGLCAFSRDDACTRLGPTGTWDSSKPLLTVVNLGPAAYQSLPKSRVTSVRVSLGLSQHFHCKGKKARETLIGKTMQSI